MRSYIDGSFASFVNPTETQGDEQIPYEVIFKNAALKKIINEKHEKSLQTFIDKPCFVNVEFNTQMSLISAVQGRFSDAVLNQVYRLEEDQENE